MPSKNIILVISILVIALAVIGFVIYSSKTIQQFSNLTISSTSQLAEEVSKDKPVFLSASIEPKKVAPGDNVTVTVEIKDDYGIVEVKADMGGIAYIMLELIEGDINQGIWQGNWLAYDTEPRNYQTMVFATNNIGKQSSISINWEDPTITDTFNNEDYIASKSNTVVTGGQVKLSLGGGSGANMILFYDGETIPDGWTLVSDSGGAFYQKFIRGAATYGGTSGAANHTHTLSLSSCGGSSDNVVRWTGDWNYASSTHTHTIGTESLDYQSNLPSYRTLKVIKYTGIPTALPAGAIAIFNTTLPTGWTQYSSQNNYYIYGEASAGTTGGSNTHQHSTTGSLANNTSFVKMYTGGSQRLGATPAHNHTVSLSSDNVDNQPSYKTVILAKKDSSGTLPLGLIAMFDSDPPSSSWTKLSGSGGELNNVFLKASATYGSTGGSSTHNHANISGNSNGPSASQSATNYSSSPNAGYATENHTHSLTFTVQTNVSHVPPYIDVILAKTVYVSSGNIVSTNLLTGQVVSSIDSFVYNLSAKPSGTGATVGFNQDGGSTWYNAAGNEGTETLVTGGEQTITLTSGWSGPNFYYKITFTSDGVDTPVLDDISVNYTSWQPRPPAINPSGGGFLIF